MSLQGVRYHLEQDDTAGQDIDLHIDLEAEDNAEAWEGIGISEEDVEGSITDLKQVVLDVSVEVAAGTDTCYRRYMRHFDLWLQTSKYLPDGQSVFREHLLEDTPLFIVAWLMAQCDTINPDGSEKQSTEVVPFTFSHAQKLRSSLTYGFGRQYKRGNNAWVFKTDAGEWDGNPSLSTEVARYMISLRKRKYASGDRYAMSSRAITSDILRKMYHYNQAERRSDIFAGTEKSPQKSVKTWGSPRRRIFVHAVVTIAFVCLMRIDEVLNLQFEDVKSSGTNRLSITLESRKTHQYGGLKPYFLWEFPKEEKELCPVSAFAAWIEASDLKNSTGYIFRAPTTTGRAPPSMNNSPIIKTSASFLELFRNNLIDIGIDPTMYGGHSLRRGGCQWLIYERRWPILRVCDWGGWSKDFNHSSILRYIFSWNDDPHEPREDFFNPNRPPTVKCHFCGRNCWCSGQ